MYEICPWLAEVLGNLKLIEEVYIPGYEKIYNRICAIYDADEDKKNYLIGPCAYYRGSLFLLIDERKSAQKFFEEALQLLSDKDRFFALSHEGLGRVIGENSLHHFQRAVDCYREMENGYNQSKTDVQRCYFRKCNELTLPVKYRELFFECRPPTHS